MADRLRILILTDRDWEHPQAGGTGTFLLGLIEEWLADGHDVTVFAGSFEGAKRYDEPRPSLRVHRAGGRLTVFSRAAAATLRGLGHDADVVLEVCNGIAFFTPLWPTLRKPRVLLVFHVHQGHYVAELGRRGAIAAFFLERFPLATLYQKTPVVTISQDSKTALEAIGVDHARITVAQPGLDSRTLSLRDKTPAPTLVYLGRLKQYKRIELLLDLVRDLPGVTLHIAGAGGHEPALRQYASQVGIEARLVFHGFVTEEQKAHLLGTSWLAVTASSAEGWSFSVVEAAASGTPTAALSVGGLKESVVDGETGILAEDYESLLERTRRILEDPEELSRLSSAALERSRMFTWSAAADVVLGVMREAIGAGRRR